ncbi:DnaJ domain-containing protein [Thiomicrorhabdus lithotrophica]|uniref:DnaJ domain-containing protein n=1 Tax=Thiomicrorhabdus lithotrophica TaxID=2949997 RepID=A0ABY8CEE6_9GAMM|nr:DnaJ domain-containing protein [Thiomicrorhabdus lithotrophica]WEJ63617.1 DnaJ domain-containing protein [Thiomicrorhabdus lithotrophica]
MRRNYDIKVDYFAVLGVHYGACSKTVKLAYRKMARRYHPDVSTIHDAQSRFQEIALAYEVLSKYREHYCREYDLRQVRSKPSSKNTSDVRSSQQSSTSSKRNGSAYRSQKPIDGKDRVITYPLTLRYAIRLLNLGSFYIPGLKLKMKFTRKAFEEKTFRIEGKGYSGLFGGKPGDFLVKFNIKIDTGRYNLKGGDIYGTFILPKDMLQAGEPLSIDAVSGKTELLLPEDYSAEKLIKITGMGLPADEITPAGDLYARLIAN